MKKILTLFLISTLCFSLVGCKQKAIYQNDDAKNEISVNDDLTENDSYLNEEISSEESDEDISEIEAGKSLVENSTTIFKELPNGLLVEKEYLTIRETELGGISIDYAYVLKNNSGKDIAYDMCLECIDAEGSYIDEDKIYLPIIPNGESFCEFGFTTLDKEDASVFDHLEIYITETSDEENETAMSHELSFVAKEVPHDMHPNYVDLIVEVSNNSEYDADIVYMVLVTYNPVNNKIQEIINMGWDDRDDYTLEAGNTDVISITMYNSNEDKQYWIDYGYFSNYEIFLYAVREENK